MDYARTIFPEVPVVGGVRLMPLSIGHALLLQRVGSPFVPPDRPAASPAISSGDIGDLALALYVCSRHWSTAAAGLSGWRSALWIRWWSCRRMGREAVDWCQFAAYWQDAWKGPGFTLIESGSGRRGAGSMHVLMITQRIQYGASRNDALSTPVLEALWDHAAYLDERGSIRLTDAVDDDVAAKVRELEACGWSPPERINIPHPRAGHG